MSDTPSIGVGLAALEAEAIALHEAVRAGDEAAIRRVAARLPEQSARDSLELADAKSAIAAEYGFESWHHLRTEVGTSMVQSNDLHRWFGAHLNNQAWDVIATGPVPTDMAASQREDLLYSAYASAWHWRQIGTAANAARGEHLISRVASCIGEPAIALKHAQRCLELVQENRDTMAEWDEPFALEALARSLAANGDMPTASSHLAEARRLTAQVEDDDDRTVLLDEFRRGPWFGLIEGL
jgi:hypothetical protein